MKKQVFSKMLLLSALALFSCQEHNDAEEQKKEASISIENVSATKNSVTFTLKSANADNAYYMLTENAEQTPDAATIASKGTCVTVGSNAEQTVENLKTSTEYTIHAVAENKDGFSQPASKTFQTEQVGLSADTAIGIYYGTRFNPAAANYYFMLTDALFENNSAQGAGTIVYLDCFGPACETPQNAIIPEGRYEYSNAITFDPFKISSESTLMMITDENGKVLDGGYFKEGYIDVKYSKDSGYAITGSFLLENGETFNIEYSGEIAFQNQSGIFGEDIEINAEHAYANVVYYGDSYGVGFSEYYFEVGTMEADREGRPLGSGYILKFDLWGETSADSDNAIIPEGTYTYNRNISLNTAASDRTEATCIIPDGTAKYTISYTAGTVNVKHEGKGYSISGEFVLQDGYKLKFSYKGELKFLNQAPAESDDINETFTDASGIYFGDIYNKGTANYSLTFKNQDDSIELWIDMNDILNDEHQVSEGTYTLDKDMDGIAGKYYSGEDFGFGPSGTYCALKQNGKTAYLYVNGGTFSVKHIEGGYDFTFDFTTTSNAKIQGSYTGEMPIKVK